MTPGLAVRDLRLEAGDRVLLDRFTLDVPAGVAVTVMGPSGCGKSSLLAWLCGLPPPGVRGEGTATLDGARLDALAPEKRRLGILFQDDLLFPHLSVGGNLAFALPPAVRGRRERQKRVTAALAEAGLEGFAHRDPTTLSGGQRARTALLRVLLAEPKALLLDEPFAKLDAELRRRFRRLVFEHARRLPVLLVTHDSEDAAAAGGPVVRLGTVTERKF